MKRILSSISLFSYAFLHVTQPQRTKKLLRLLILLQPGEHFFDVLKFLTKKN